MKHIIRDFYRAHISLLVRYAVIVAICVGAFFLTGIFARENTRIAGIIVAAFMLAMLCWALIDVLIAAPRGFKNVMNRLPEASFDEITSEYASAVKVGKRYFYKETWLIFYSYRRIKLLRYDEIRSADLKRANNIFLTLCDGKTVLMPVEPNENGEMLLAALRQKNNNITVLLDGKPAGSSEGKDNS